MGHNLEREDWQRRYNDLLDAHTTAVEELKEARFNNRLVSGAIVLVTIVLGWAALR